MTISAETTFSSEGKNLEEELSLFVDEESSGEKLAEVSRILKTKEAELQVKVSQTFDLCNRLLELETKMDARVEELEAKREKVSAQFDRINKTNKQLAAKSTKIFKKLQLLSKKFAGNQQNQNLFGVLSQSNSLIRLKMKENETFLESLEKDVQQVD